MDHQLGVLRSARFVVTAALLWLLAAPPAAALEGSPSTRAAAGFDLDGDGRPEIERLEVLVPPVVTPRWNDRPLVLLLVEKRLLAPLDRGPAPERLVHAIARWCADVRREGSEAAALSVRFSTGGRHQDGLSLLALRRVLRMIAATAKLEGVVLLGRFPDAFVVRSCNWRKRGRVVLRRGRTDALCYENVPYLRVVPEAVAPRCDLVLADLDGRWEALYHLERTELRSVVAVFPSGVPDRGGVPLDVEWGAHTFEDVFFVDDGPLEIERREEASGPPRITPLPAPDAECAPADLALAHPLARPEIWVSRIEVHGAALEPGPDKTLRFDPVLERRLLLAYFERNHRYRTGRIPRSAFRATSIHCGLPSGQAALNRAFPAWRCETDQVRRQATNKGDADLEAFVRWLERPAIVRDIRAHSEARSSRFRRADPQAIAHLLDIPRATARRIARRAWADFSLYRRLWDVGKTPEVGWVGLHLGCDFLRPIDAHTQPFHSARYARLQAAHAVLAYGGALAVCGRAKVFYDAPRGFYETLANRRRFGEAWRNYFECEGNTRSLSRLGGRIGRKRSYFWNVLGDASLRVPEAPAH